MAAVPPVRKRVVRTCAVTGSAVLLLSACGGRTDTAEPAQLDLDGGWHLADGHDARGSLPLQHGRITLVVDGDEAGGGSGCNTYGTSVDVEGQAVRFARAAGTEMACAPQVMVLESRYLDALAAVREGDRRGRRLRLSGPGVVLDFGLDPPVVDADLVGTDWVLESVVEGESVSSALPGAALVLRADGRFEATTGCGAASGRYALRSSEVRVSDLQAGVDPAARCTEQAVAQHEHIVDVLGQRFTASVVGDRLTLTGGNSLGLDFRAR